jgi:hypothetical protein
MTLRHRLEDPGTRLRIGMAFLLLASLSQWFLHPTAAFGQDTIDAARGLFLGLAIGFSLWAVRGRARGEG